METEIANVSIMLQVIDYIVNWIAQILLFFLDSTVTSPSLARTFQHPSCGILILSHTHLELAQLNVSLAPRLELPPWLPETACPAQGMS